MYELRILNGLHRGAALPLDDSPHLIGASDDADVVLVDSCIAQEHATLSRTDSGWMLTAENGQVFGADHNDSQLLIDLNEGDFARLGDVWLSVMHQDDDWTDPPPVPVDARVTDESDEHYFEPELVVEAQPRAIETPVLVRKIDDIDDNSTPLRQGLRRRFVFIPVAAIVVLSAAAAYGMKSKDATDVLPKKLDLTLTDSLSHARKPMSASELSASRKGRNDLAKPVPNLSQEELQRAFRKKLTDADLAKRFDFNLADSDWSLQGDLNDEETKRFERILQTFMREHRIAFPVSAKIVNAENMLPFKIRQVITGANASVVTQEGERLYVGEEFRGVRVVAIQNNHLTFAGKRKIEVNW